MSTREDFNSIGGRLAFAIKEIGKMTSFAVSQATGISESTISRIIKNKTKPNYSTLRAIGIKVGVSPNWLMHGGDDTIEVPENFVNFVERSPEYMDELHGRIKKLEQENKKLSRASKKQSNAEPITPRHLGEGHELELIKREDLTEFRQLGEDRYIVICPLVRTEAFRAYPDIFEDPDFLSQLQKHAIAVDDLQFGEYMSFEAPIEHHGSSSEDFIGEGWIVTGKKVEKSTLKRGISFRKYPTYIVVVKRGILLLHVVDYDRDEQSIRFSGPENEHYPNSLIPFDHILELYSTIAVTDPRR